MESVQAYESCYISGQKFWRVLMDQVLMKYLIFLLMITCIWYHSDWMLGKMMSALYLFLLVIGLNIDTAALSMISGSGKLDS